jgi:glutamine synthetase
MDQETLRGLLARGELDTVVVAGVDYQGRLFGKHLAAGYILDPERDGTFASVAVLASDMQQRAIDGLTFGGAQTGFNDLLLRPDYSTARLLPWFERTALVLADIFYRDRTEVPTSPRAVLKAQLKRAHALGFKVHVASELEFYLFKESPESVKQKGYRDLRPISDFQADYSLLRSSREEWFLRLLRNELTAAGIPVESTKSEYGAGQMEVNLLYSDALEMADRHVIFKHAVKEISQLYGFLATFMAKPFSDQAGSGGHIHMNLVEEATGRSVFRDPHGDGPSDMLLSFLAGIQLLTPPLFLLYAPHVNSYKRFVPKNFAPILNNYGLDDRTAAFRIAGEGDSIRVENRLPGADINGYLAIAAMLASGLYGIENDLRPLNPAVVPEAGEAESTGHADERLPQDPVEAIDLLESSEPARELLGQELVNDLVAFSKAEVRTYFREVTDWERQSYLEQA